MSLDLSVGDQFVREVVVSSVEGVVVVTAAGDVVFANDGLRDLLGHDRGELVGGRFVDLCPDEDVESLRAAVGEDQPVALDASVRRANGDRVPVRLSVETNWFDGRRYFTVRVRDRPGATHDRGTDADATGRAEAGVDRPSADRSAPDGRAGQLEVLVELGRDLSSAGTVEAVAETGLAGVERLFGSGIACVRLLDGDSNRLERVATTDKAADLVAERPAFDLDATLAGRALRQGEPVAGSPTAVDGGADREGLHVPLGDRGAVTVYLPPGDGVTGADRDVAALYGTVLTAALERVDRPDGAGAPPDDSDRDAIRMMEELAGTMHDAVTEILHAETEAQVKERLCDGLGVAAAFDRVRVIETDVDEGWTVVATHPGRPDDERADGVVPSQIDAVESAAATGEVTTTVTESDDTPAAGTGVAGQTAAVPITYDGRTYGTFIVYSDGNLPLTPTVQSALETVGQIAGFAISAVENRKLFLSEERVELEFEVTGPDCLAVPVSDACECYCEITHNTLTSDGDHLVYLEADDADPETVVEAAAGVESVTDCRVVDASGDGCLVEVTKTESGAEAMLDYGATVLRADAEEGVGTLVVEAPTSVDAHALADAYTSRNPDSHLVAKRVVDQPVEVSPPVREDLESVLTDKQRTALETAYHAGYYDWPRGSTAEGVASSLGISSPTLHQHLRKAVRKLLAREFE